jgi:hypothetical protein
LGLQQPKRDTIDIVAAIDPSAASQHVVSLSAVSRHVRNRHVVSLRVLSQHVLTIAVRLAAAKRHALRPIIAARRNPHAAPRHQFITGVNRHVVDQLSTAEFRLLRHGQYQLTSSSRGKLIVHAAS